MLIEIQCGNFSDYDAALGRYVECGEKVIVSSDRAGEMITCAKCQQNFEIPIGNGAKSAELEREAQQPANNSAPRSNPKRKKSPASKTRPTRRTGSSSDSGELVLAAPLERSSSDVMSMDFEQHPVASTVATDRKVRCTKCGNVSVRGKCSKCNHIEPHFKKIHEPVENISIQIAGFQRWACQTLSEGTNIQMLEYAGHIGFGILGGLLLCGAIISIFGMGLGKTGGLALLVFVIAAVCFYVGLIYKGHQFLRDPRARLAWFQKPFWNLLLMSSRAMNWQSYDAQLKGRKIIKIRDASFGDDEIGELDGLKNCQVIDWEGTAVTDRGLMDLCRLRNLHCVVLRRTSVTSEGIFRLQQSLPQLWIWH